MASCKIVQVADLGTLQNTNAPHGELVEPCITIMPMIVGHMCIAHVLGTLQRRLVSGSSGDQNPFGAFSDHDAHRGLCGFDIAVPDCHRNRLMACNRPDMTFRIGYR